MDISPSYISATLACEGTRQQMQVLREPINWTINRLRGVGVRLCFAFSTFMLSFSHIFYFRGSELVKWNEINAERSISFTFVLFPVRYAGGLLCYIVFVCNLVLLAVVSCTAVHCPAVRLAAVSVVDWRTDGRHMSHADQLIRVVGSTLVHWVGTVNHSASCCVRSVKQRRATTRESTRRYVDSLCRVPTYIRETPCWSTSSRVSACGLWMLECRSACRPQFLWTTAFVSASVICCHIPRHSRDSKSLHWRGRPNRGRLTLYRWCTVVSGQWNMMNPRLKMSHEGTARVRHFQLRVIIFQCRTNDNASCFVMWPNTSLKLCIVLWDGGEKRVKRESAI